MSQETKNQPISEDDDELIFADEEDDELVFTDEEDEELISKIADEDKLVFSRTNELPSPTGDTWKILVVDD